MIEHKTPNNINMFKIKMIEEKLKEEGIMKILVIEDTSTMLDIVILFKYKEQVYNTNIQYLSQNLNLKQEQLQIAIKNNIKEGKIAAMKYIIGDSVKTNARIRPGRINYMHTQIKNYSKIDKEINIEDYYNRVNQDKLWELMGAQIDPKEVLQYQLDKYNVNKQSM